MLLLRRGGKSWCGHFAASLRQQGRRTARPMPQAEIESQVEVHEKCRIAKRLREYVAAMGL